MDAECLNDDTSSVCFPVHALTCSNMYILYVYLYLFYDIIFICIVFIYVFVFMYLYVYMYILMFSVFLCYYNSPFCCEIHLI
jgi:hypothetical protein